MKHLKWDKLTQDILDSLQMNQEELGGICRVTQQCVSNWTTRTRSPGVYARNELRELAVKAGLNLKHYQRERFSLRDQEELNLSEDLLEFIQHLNSCPQKLKQDIISMAEFMMKKNY